MKLKELIVEQKEKMEEAIKKKVRFKSFYEKYESDENLPRPLSLSEVYESKSEGRSLKSDSEASDTEKE